MPPRIKKKRTTDTMPQTWPIGQSILIATTERRGAVPRTYLFESGPQGIAPLKTDTRESEKQQQILQLLWRRAMKLRELAEALDCDPSRLQRDHLKPLMKRGEIENDRAKGGYYRPAAPPCPDPPHCEPRKMPYSRQSTSR
jgi:hypothetical protein